MNEMAERAVIRERQSIGCGRLCEIKNGTAPPEFARAMMMALDAASEEAIKEWHDFYKLAVYTAVILKMLLTYS